MGRARTQKPADQKARFDSRLVRALVVFVGVSLVVAAVAAVSRFTRGRIVNWERYNVPFSEIDCLPPPGQTRAEFLEEVRELAGFPEQLQVVDDDLAARLGQAFARHPAVEQVVAVMLGSSRQIQVRLIHRMPELEVLLTDAARKGAMKSAADRERSWIVDRFGVLLPRKNPDEKLPIFFATVPPAGSVGERWGDPSIEAAAATAGYLRQADIRQRRELGLRVFEISSGNLILCTLAGTRVLWGHAPGAETPDEAKAATKLMRLLEYIERNTSLDKPSGHYEHDVRPLDKATHKELPLEG